MITITLALCAALQDPLQDGFPKLQEAWKTVGEARAKKEKASGLTDDLIRAFGKVAAAYEAAGLFDEDAGFEARAMKRLLNRRASALLPASGDTRYYAIAALNRARGEAAPVDGLERFEKAIAKLAELKAKGADDEDNVQEVMVDARKALKDLGLVRDEQPQWQRRRVLAVARALVTGDAYPARARATPEQEKRVKELIVQLGDSELERRDEATRELDKLGEPAVPLLQEALKHADSEVRERAKKLLGIGLKEPEEQSRLPERDRDLIEVEGALTDLQRAIEVIPGKKK